MNDSPGAPPEPEAQPVKTPPGVPAPPPGMIYVPHPKPDPRSKIVGATGTASLLKRAIIALVVLAVIGGASYFVGWKLGYRAGTNASSSCFGGLNINDDSPNCGAGPASCPSCGVVSEEPVIYLYPVKAESVQVQVGYPAGFSYTSPTYNAQSGWQVVANPNGQLTDPGDGKQYPYLIWEGKPAPLKFNMSTGFVVPGAQTAGFLRQELAKAGLTSSEIDSFIAYWQPKMSGNPYNLIHFAGSEYTDYAKLKISPQPDAVLRVYMAFEPLTQPVSVTPQSFPAFQRKGFTVVEWGGGEL